MGVYHNMVTKEREIGALVKLRNYIPDAKCLVITKSEETEMEWEGINISVVPM